ncbi:MAG: hypothetical protein QXT33_07760 [Thermofilum sp.]
MRVVAIKAMACIALLVCVVAIAASLKSIDSQGSASGSLNHLPQANLLPQKSEDLVGKHLQELNACSGLQLGEGDTLILKYRFVPPDKILIIEEGGRDFVVSAGDALLTVEVSRAGGGYRVLFRLTYKGVGLRPAEEKPPKEWEGVEFSIVRELLTVYDPGRGYSLLNGTLLGRLLPLFERGEVLSVDYLWARPGERYDLGRKRPIHARLAQVTVWDLEKRVALVLNGSQIVASKSFDEFYGKSYVEDVIKRTEGLRALGGCPNLLASVHYVSASGEVLFEVSIDYPTSVPTFILMEGAARYAPGGEYVRNGRLMVELPASLLAELFGIRSTTLALELEDVQVERRG